MSQEEIKSQEDLAQRDRIKLLERRLIAGVSTTPDDIDGYSDEVSRMARVKNEYDELTKGLSEEELKTISKEVQIESLEDLVRVMRKTGWTEKAIDEEILLICSKLR